MTLVPTPSVLITRIGDRYPSGIRTIPPNAPMCPTEYRVRALRTEWAMRSLAASALPRSTPAAA